MTFCEKILEIAGGVVMLLVWIAVITFFYQASPSANQKSSPTIERNSK